MTRVYKRPTSSEIYWALAQTRDTERACYGQVAYRHVRREANEVADDMARRAAEAEQGVRYWWGEVPEGAPANQVDAVYAQWARLRGPRMDWGPIERPDWVAAMEPAPASRKGGRPSAAAVFGVRCASRGAPYLR